MLEFDIDIQRLYAVMDELEPTEKQIRLAMNRALNRTAATLRRLSATGLKKEFDLRAVGLLKKRLNALRLKSGGLDVVKLWYGINGMPVSWFKGRARKTSTGASFRNENFEDGFVAKSSVKGRKTVFKRKAEKRLPLVEQLMPIKDQAEVFVEDHIFDKLENIFWQHFTRDLKARVRFKLGGE